MLRTKINETLLEQGMRKEYGAKPEELFFPLLEAEFVVRSNDMFHNILDQVAQETGSPDPKRVFAEWERWLKKQVQLRKITVP